MAISFNMLNNTAVLFKQNGFDEDRNPVESDGFTLSKIYCVSTQSVRDGNNGKESGDSMTLFFDVYVSEPKGTVFNMGDRIIFDNVDYRINSISPYYNQNGLHHYEIGLI